MSYLIIIVLVIALGLLLLSWLIAIDGVSRNVRKLQKRRLEIDKRINKLLAKLSKSRRLFFFKQNADTKEVYDYITNSLEQRVDISKTKDKVYELLVYLQQQPFEYWWLVEKLNMIYATCEEAIDCMEKIRKYRRPLPRILKKLPYRDSGGDKEKPKGGLNNGVQQS